MIDVDGVTCRYDPDGDAAITDVSLQITDGECLVLAGANGSGKTTLVRTFNGLVTPTTGRVTVDGTPVTADLVAARSAVGMVFQDPRDQFVAATVGADVAFGPENLGLSRETIRQRVTTALEAVNLTERRADRIETLSGGEKQRAAVAGALAMDPTHLVCDEPFTGLDRPARESLRDHFRSLVAAGTSLVIVTHDLRAVCDLADRVVGLDAGRLVLDGPVESVRDELAALGVEPPRAPDS